MCIYSVYFHMFMFMSVYIPVCMFMWHCDYKNVMMSIFIRVTVVETMIRDEFQKHSEEGIVRSYWFTTIEVQWKKYVNDYNYPQILAQVTWEQEQGNLLRKRNSMKPTVNSFFCLTHFFKKFWKFHIIGEIQPWPVWLSGLSTGHMPGLRDRSPVGGAREATTHWCFSPSLSPSFPSL